MRLCEFLEGVRIDINKDILNGITPHFSKDKDIYEKHFQEKVDRGLKILKLNNIQLED